MYIIIIIIYIYILGMELLYIDLECMREEGQEECKYAPVQVKLSLYFKTGSICCTLSHGSV